MKKLTTLFYLAFCLILTISVSSCNSNKIGCPVNENAHVKTDRKGNFKSGKGKSNLFPKNMRSKKKKKG